jgi:hypothetical protein
MDMGTWGHGDKGTWGHGDKERGDKARGDREKKGQREILVTLSGVEVL